MSNSYEDTFPAGPQPDESGSRRSDSGGASTGLGGTTPTSGNSDVLNRVVQGAHQTVDRLAETAAPQVQRLEDVVASARELGGELSESLRDNVRANPLLMLAAALAVGMVIGRVSR